MGPSVARSRGTPELARANHDEEIGASQDSFGGTGQSGAAMSQKPRSTPPRRPALMTAMHCDGVRNCSRADVPRQHADPAGLLRKEFAATADQVQPPAFAAASGPAHAWRRRLGRRTNRSMPRAPGSNIQPEANRSQLAAAPARPANSDGTRPATKAITRHYSDAGAPFRANHRPCASSRTRSCSCSASFSTC